MAETGSLLPRNGADPGGGFRIALVDRAERTLTHGTGPPSNSRRFVTGGRRTGGDLRRPLAPEAGAFARRHHHPRKELQLLFSHHYLHFAECAVLAGALDLAAVKGKRPSRPGLGKRLFYRRRPI